MRDFGTGRRQKLNLLNPEADGGNSQSVQACFKNVESGAFFQKDSYAIYGMFSFLFSHLC